MPAMTWSQGFLACALENPEQFVASLKDGQVRALPYHWSGWARDDQLAPDGEWTIWLFLGGRGAGKTRAGAEWIRARAESGQARRIALVGATAADVRDVMVRATADCWRLRPHRSGPVSNRRSGG